MAFKTLGGSPIPLREPISGPRGLLTTIWHDYFMRLPLTLSRSVELINSVSLNNQSATLPATDFSGGPFLSGLYRITYYVRIVTMPSVSGSLVVTLRWTDGGVAQTFAGTTISVTGDTTTASQSGTHLIRCDAGTSVTYATTYSSTAAGTMTYNLDTTFEKVKA